MADLDDELLALAGDDDSRSGSESPGAIKEKTPSPPPGPSKEEAQPESSGKMGRKGVARRKKPKREDDEEEGELASSPMSRNSLESAPMSESDSEGESHNEDGDGPIFPFEKLFYSQQDKEEVLALPEVEREQILSERDQQVERRTQENVLRRLLAMRERDGAQADKKKRKASATELDENQRKSSRQKTTLGGRKVGEASDAIEAYKRQREQKSKRDEQRRRESAKKKDDRSVTPERESPDRHRRGSSEVEWDDGKRRSGSPAENDSPAELHDFERARIGRVGFGQVCFYPRFEETVTNCYVRVNVGLNKQTGKDDYRMCLIKKFTEGRPYAMEGPNGRNFITSQYAILSQGKAEKEFPLIACSESRFTEGEFNRYRQTMIVEGYKMPTKSTLVKKNADIHRLINHKFTQEELEEKLRKQGTNDNKKLIYERIQLERRRQNAVAAGDEAAIADCDSQLAQLSGPKLAFGTNLVNPRSNEKTQQDRLAEINRRNQKLNTENIRKAQLQERKKERVTAAAVARGEALPDPFARVKTRARTHYDVNGDRLVPKRPEDEGSDISRGMTPQTGSNTPNKSSTPKRSPNPTSNPAANNGVEKKEHKGVPVIRHRPHDDEVIGALDFDIDIEL